MKKQCSNCNEQYEAWGNQKFCGPGCKSEFNLKNEKMEVDDKVYPTTTVQYTGDCFLKLYRVDQKLASNGKIKVFIKVKADGNIVMTESLTSTPIGDGRIFEHSDKPSQEESWAGVVFVDSIISEFLTENGTIKLALMFQYFDNKSDRLKITQMIPRHALDRYDTKVGHGSSRSKKVDDVKNWIDNFKISEE